MMHFSKLLFSLIALAFSQVVVSSPLPFTLDRLNGRELLNTIEAHLERRQIMHATLQKHSTGQKFVGAKNLVAKKEGSPPVLSPKEREKQRQHEAKGWEMEGKNAKFEHGISAERQKKHPELNPTPPVQDKLDFILKQKLRP
ncbi:hypothetical protein CPB83DRAFT_366629 [Crepidotus variabilis]|uniref:Uncharacterized protein n=1 Tax=Crepidotus variabilis TaxID=179855 RepID=A0A9P6EFM5_9AGAR|nr:hypothetical protein CPB83DRAFT_366629 [Crepidotus variabilis]